MAEIRNAVIERVSLSDDDHDLLSAWLHLDYGGMGQGFGGYALYLPKSWRHHELKSFAGHFIWRCMEIAEVREWSKLPGKTIRVEIDDNGIISAIGHIVKNDWFRAKADFAESSLASGKSQEPPLSNSEREGGNE